MAVKVPGSTRSVLALSISWAAGYSDEEWGCFRSVLFRERSILIPIMKVACMWCVNAVCGPFVEPHSPTLTCVACCRYAPNFNLKRISRKSVLLECRPDNEVRMAEVLLSDIYIFVNGLAKHRRLRGWSQREDAEEDQQSIFKSEIEVSNTDLELGLKYACV